MASEDSPDSQERKIEQMIGAAPKDYILDKWKRQDNFSFIDIMPRKFEKTRTVSFLLPIINGQIYLGQRGTPPFQGFYGGIGGKAEAKSDRYLHNQKQLITTHGGHKKTSLTDIIASQSGLELFSETAIREFCEEIFSKSKFPENFTKQDITDIYGLGFIRDVLPEEPKTQNICYFYIANVNRTDFSPSPREILNFKSINQIPLSQIFPLTKMALNHLEYSLNPDNGLSIEKLEPYKKYDLYKQITISRNEERKFTSMMFAYPFEQSYFDSYEI
ncbi:MAG TPA: hypothetical protein VEC16_02530 [Alphaproteobacteria bacterium]|nr:hypothetical protein [Alphaproteobacteria bacterium]